ncbi:MAG: 1,2-phenylacetyl-CoA epoxidase subunit PaaD [Chitinophagales bacterium]|nr:1,2-phenylacetyl-CoA epoxidase subunit PaaD [Chitinophagales bacterium]
MKQLIYAALEQVKDPEIPVLSVLDMGIINEAKAEGLGHVEVIMTPTFVGCPALDVIKSEIEKALLKAGFKSASVNVDYQTKWTSDRMSAEAKEKLRKFGIAPPTVIHGEITEEALNDVRCPYCGSTDTTLRAPFGSTLCRAIRFCFSCRQGFEQFKPV